MKIELKITKEYDVKFLQVEAGARYWEDSMVDGEPDKDGSLIPCRDGHSWSPLIDIETGHIVNWELGKTADIHYKVCDAGTYKVLDENQEIIKEIEGYVPDMLCPDENGYGDYIIMHIDKDGLIKGFKATFEEFINDEE